MSAMLLIASGGTGGHMFPALALADEILGRGHQVALVVDDRGRRWVRGDYDVHLVAAAKPSLGVLGRGLGAVQGLEQCLRLLHRLRPSVAACFGGYASFPPALACRLQGRPIVVHEQNAVLGLANRMLARFAERLALSFADTDRAPPLSATTVVTGNPLRRGFAAAPGAQRTAMSADGRLRVLVMGGSQGAAIFARVLPDAFALLSLDMRTKLRLVQQARPEDLGQVQARYATLAIQAEVAPFFDDIPARLGACDLVITRSGASTVAEVTACGRPAIYIPYAHAAADHQYANAVRIERAGGGLVVREIDATPQKLAALIGDLVAQPARLAAMAEAAGSFSRPNATSDLADLVLSVAGAGR